MKIAVIHWAYDERLPSGENDVVMTEIMELKALGHSVQLFPNKIPFKLPLFLRVILHSITINWFISRYDPDVIHLHNGFPLPIKSRYKLGGKNVPHFATVHSFRFRCIQGSHFRKGSPCTTCNHITKSKRVWISTIRKCYKSSFLFSLLASYWQNYVYMKYIMNATKVYCVSDQIHSTLSQVGLNKTKLKSEPASMSYNFSVDTIPKTNEIVFAGRLTVEKGLKDLVEAWIESKIFELGFSLVIAGEGPLKDFILRVSRMNVGIQFRGVLKENDLQKLISGCHAVCVPSISHEGFPRMIVFAAMNGKSVIYTKMGERNSLEPLCWQYLLPESVSEWSDALKLAILSGRLDEHSECARKWWKNNASLHSTIESRMTDYSLAINKF